jgi:opacity protein-like surface antigen
MKKILFSTALLATSIATAATPIDGWYAGAFGGYAYLSGNLNKTDHGLLRNHSEYKHGYDAGGSFGFKSTPLRYEGELTYIKGWLERFKLNRLSQTGVVGNNQAGFAMANIYYDLPQFVQSVEPFIGIGIGYGFVNGIFKSNGPLEATRYKTSDSVFAYQGTAGLTYNFAESWALNVSYRYIATDKVHSFGKLFQASLANVGGVYRFDGNIYK